MAIHGYLGGVISATAPSVTTAGASGVFTLEEQLQASAQNNWPGYQISRSVRLRASASAYFNRTPASASNRTTWTWSAWVKRGKLGAAQVLFSAGTGTAEFRLGFISSDAIEIYEYTSPSYNWQKITTAVYRDPSAWYHIELTYDTTNGTAANRIKLYVNGTQVTSFSTDTNPTSSFSGYVNSAVAHGIGSFSTGANYLDGYLTEINFVDGQALTPTSFGAFDAVTGIWNPIKYSGTYGTNGFYLNFSDNSSNTATTIGKDYSGNGNNWTPNNISVTAGTTYDSMVDVPIGYGSDTGVGGELRGNYATFNPIVAATGITISDGNLKGTNTTSFNTCTGTIAIAENTNKYYWEIVSTSSAATPCLGFHGVQKASKAGTVPTTAGNGAYCYYGSSGQYWADGTNSAYGSTYAVNDVIGVALDASSSPATITFYKNNVSQGIKTLPALTNDYWLPIGNDQGGSSPTYVINFGQRPFSYTAPSGFKALCTQNLPTPTVNNGANYMAANLYTGTGASQTINNSVNSISFQPDLVWVKSRSAGTDNKLTDSVRGVTKGLVSNSVAAETTDTNGLTAFGATGFTLGSDTNYNNSGATYVGWQWKGGGTAVTNTSGSVTSTVSANTTAGFSIATFTAPTSGICTVGHGLGVAPRFFFIKSRANAYGWTTYHVSVGNTAYLVLNSTAGLATDANTWNNTSPTSSVFTLGTNFQNTSTWVAYCFAPVTGYSAFGSYTGNGSTDGPFVYCGFRPRFVLVKRFDSTGNWFIWDAARNTYNAVNNQLYPDSSSFEQQADGLDFVSNGFKIRFSSTYADRNASGGTYIYAAFAENPFNISRAR